MHQINELSRNVDPAACKLIPFPWFWSWNPLNRVFQIQFPGKGNIPFFPGSVQVTQQIQITQVIFPGSCSATTFQIIFPGNSSREGTFPKPFPKRILIGSVGNRLMSPLTSAAGQYYCGLQQTAVLQLLGKTTGKFQLSITRWLCYQIQCLKVES